jgi:hypothetical protein
MNKTKIVTLVISLTLGAVTASAEGGGPPVAPPAPTPTTPVFTTTAVLNGVVIVDQTTGAVTYCTSLVNVSNAGATPSDACAFMGRATPTSGSSTSLTVTASGSSVFVLNNVTGIILQCATIENIVGSTGKPEGSCVTFNASK